MEQLKRKVIKQDELVSTFMNTETGEIEYSLRDGDSIRVDTREQKEYRANHKTIKKNNLFVKVYKDTISILADEDLTKSEYKIILKALSYLDKVSGILIEDGVNISKNRFIEITKLSHNTFTERVNHLIDLQIMTRAKVGRANVYMINPFIFENETYINTTLYRLFKKSK